MFAALPLLFAQFCGSPHREPAPIPPAEPPTAGAPSTPPSPPPTGPAAPAGPPTSAVGSPIGACPSRGLGSASGFNVYVLGDFVGRNSNVGGSIAVGGSLQVDGYALGSGLGARPGPSLLVGGDAVLENSQVYGAEARVRGRCTTRSIGAPANGLQCGAPDAPQPAASERELVALARWLAAQPERACSVHADAWGAVQIHATGPSAVCTLDLDAVADGFGPSVYNGWINGLRLDAPSGATVVINVRGDNSLWGKSGQFQLTGGLRPTQVLWNFGDAPRLGISGVGVNGTVLAPSAAVRFDNGTLVGQLVARSFIGTGQFQDAPFAGALCP